MICGGLRVGPSAPLALPPSVFHSFILLAPCSRVPENLAGLPRLDASAGFASRCWRKSNPQKKEGSNSPHFCRSRPNKWRTIFFVEWYDCAAFVAAPLTQLTAIARVSPEPADACRLQGLSRVKSFYHGFYYKDSGWLVPSRSKRNVFSLTKQLSRIVFTSLYSQ